MMPNSTHLLHPHMIPILPFSAYPHVYPWVNSDAVIPTGKGHISQERFEDCDLNKGRFGNLKEQLGLKHWGSLCHCGSCKLQAGNSKDMNGCRLLGSRSIQVTEGIIYSTYQVTSHKRSFLDSTKIICFQSSIKFLFKHRHRG